MEEIISLTPISTLRANFFPPFNHGETVTVVPIAAATQKKAGSASEM